MGPRLKLEYVLYKDKGIEPYRTLHLWVASHLDFEQPEIVARYMLFQEPEVTNSDFEHGKSGWTFTSNNPYFRGMFHSTTAKPVENSTIKGYVHENETGLPIPYVLLSANDRYGWANRTRTNASGYYELKTVAGRLWLDCWTGGYNRIEMELVVAEEEEQIVSFDLDVIPIYNVTIIPQRSEEEPAQVIVQELPQALLPPGVVTDVKGEVVDNVTGLPVTNASVQFSHYGFAKSTNTSSDGRFELSVRIGGMNIRTRAEGYRENRTWINTSKTRDILIRLTPEGSRIKGWVHNESGEPVGDVRIRVGDHIGPGRQTYSKTTTSNSSSGYYELMTTAGHFWLRAEKEGHFVNLTELELEYGEAKEQNVLLRSFLDATAEVYGYVLCNDTGLSGVEVTLIEEGYEKTVRTNESGFYKLEKVPAGRFLLFAESEVYSECMELNATVGQKLRVDLPLESSSLNTYEISFPNRAKAKYGDYGAIYQDVNSEEEGIAVLSFKVRDSYVSNKSRGYHFKQVLLDDVVIWEDDVAGDEDWREVKIPVTLNRGSNRLAFRVYDKQSVGWFPVKVWYDDVRIEPLSEVALKKATPFYILDANGGVDYPT